LCWESNLDISTGKWYPKPTPLPPSRILRLIFVDKKKKKKFPNWLRYEVL